MIILIIILVVLLIMTAAFGFYGAGYSLNIRRQTLEEARTWQENHYDLSWYDPLGKTDYTVTSYDGYVLHAQFLPNPDRSSKYIIISHGYSDNLFGAPVICGEHSTRFGERDNPRLQTPAPFHRAESGWRVKTAESLAVLRNEIRERLSTFTAPQGFLRPRDKCIA